MKDLGLQVFSAKIRSRVKTLCFVALMTAAVICHCQDQGSINSFSLSTEGILKASDRSAAILICTVTYNSSNVTIHFYFYLNNTKLSINNALMKDGTLDLIYNNESCYEEPQPPRKCEEKLLIIRTAPQLNNTLITCKTRAINDHQNNSGAAIASNLLEKHATLIISEPDSPTTLTPTTSSSSSTRSMPSVTPTPTSEPTENGHSVAENSTSTIFPEGRERVYVVAVGSETILLIISLCVTIFLLIVLCKKKKVQQNFDLVQARSMSPEAAEEKQLDEKPSYHHNTDSPTQGRLEGSEPRYTQCSHV